jgi:hypothetical protein
MLDAFLPKLEEKCSQSTNLALKQNHNLMNDSTALNNAELTELLKETNLFLDEYFDMNKRSIIDKKLLQSIENEIAKSNKEEKLIDKLTKEMNQISDTTKQDSQFVNQEKFEINREHSQMLENENSIVNNVSSKY